jgi:site-specific recombinase XerC
VPRQSRRKRIGKYVYEDKNGISAVVYVKGQKRVELRFPRHTPLAEIRRAQELRAIQLRAMVVSAVPVAGTVAEVIASHNAHLDLTMPDRDERGRLAAWTAACGEEQFATLTRGQLNAIVEAWRRAGIAPSTINKRISSFRKVARGVADATNDDVPPHAVELMKRLRPPRSGEIRARPLPLVLRVLDQVADHNPTTGALSKSKIRLRVWTWTGQNPAQLQAVRPEHVRWHAKPYPELYIQPRRKGEGVDAAWIPLHEHAVTALRDFFAADAGGPWNKGVLLRAWKTGRKKAQHQLKREHRHHEAAQLDGMLPRDLRHSFGTAYQMAGGDLHATGEYLRHSDLKTTRIYTTGAASPRMRAGIAALETVTRGPEFSTEKRSSVPKDFSEKTPERRGRKTKGAGKCRTHTERPEATAGQALSR